jgi:hypothetical protein
VGANGQNDLGLSTGLFVSPYQQDDAQNKGHGTHHDAGKRLGPTRLARLLDFVQCEDSRGFDLKQQAYTGPAALRRTGGLNHWWRE